MQGGGGENNAKPLLLGHIVELTRVKSDPVQNMHVGQKKTIPDVFAARDSSDLLGRVMAVENSSLVRFLPVRTYFAFPRGPTSAGGRDSGAGFPEWLAELVAGFAGSGRDRLPSSRTKLPRTLLFLSVLNSW
jgi:hypothetical protein